MRQDTRRRLHHRAQRRLAPISTTSGLQQAIDGGWVEGPRIVPAAYAIGATGGHCDDNGLPPSYDKKGESVVNGPAEARAKVRWLHKYGAEVIKICATGGVFSLGDRSAGSSSASTR